jgi:flagellar hook-associated protein FlgK
MRLHIHIHHHYEGGGHDEMVEKLNFIMANIAELTQKVDDLQVALDAEQQQIMDAVNELSATIADLQALVADGGSEAERQALADKLDSIKSDLEATIIPPTEEEEEETETPETPEEPQA